MSLRQQMPDWWCDELPAGIVTEPPLPIWLRDWASLAESASSCACGTVRNRSGPLRVMANTWTVVFRVCVPSSRTWIWCAEHQVSSLTILSSGMKCLISATCACAGTASVSSAAARMASLASGRGKCLWKFHCSLRRWKIFKDIVPVSPAASRARFQTGPLPEIVPKKGCNSRFACINVTLNSGWHPALPSSPIEIPLPRARST